MTLIPHVIDGQETVGDSGIGREGGSFSREFFTEPKAVVMEI